MTNGCVYPVAKILLIVMDTFGLVNDQLSSSINIPQKFQEDKSTTYITRTIVVKQNI